MGQGISQSSTDYLPSPRCGCGAKLILVSNPPCQEFTKATQHILAQEKSKHQKPRRGYEFWDHVPNKGLISVVVVFEKVLEYCLCCATKFVPKETIDKNNGKSDINTDNNNTSDLTNYEYEYYQCPNETCFMRNRHKIEQVIRNTKCDYYDMKSIPQEAFDCVRFRICKKCGDIVDKNYNIMTTTKCASGGKNNKNIKNTNSNFFQLPTFKSKDILTINHDFNTILNIWSYMKQNPKKTQTAAETEEWTERKQDQLYDEHNQFHKALDQIEQVFYREKKKLKLQVQTLDEQCPQCICGNGDMTAKINCRGKWDFRFGIYCLVDGKPYYPTKLKCNVCTFQIEQWDPYFTCKFGKIMTTVGHEMGFRICKLCAILLNESKSKPYQNTIANNKNINNTIFERLSDDVMYLVLQYAISSYIELINLSRVNKYFSSHLSLIGKAFTTLAATCTDTDSSSTCTDTLQKDLKIMPQLNQIWKQLVLFYWPTFMEKKMIDKYSNNIHQRWDLLFKVRFKSLQKYFNDGYGPLRKDTFNDKKRMPNHNGQPFKFHKLNQVKFIENCNENINEYNKMVLKEMEDMGFEYEFRCPLWKDELKFVISEVTKTDGVSINHECHHCKVCNKNVYTATTKQQVTEYVSKGVCFQFKPKHPPLLRTHKLIERFPRPVRYGTSTSKKITLTSSMEQISSGDSDDNSNMDAHKRCRLGWR